MTIKQNEYDITSELLQSFSKYNLILYVGTGIKESEVVSSIWNLSWKCVITSQRQTDFGKFLVTEQRNAKRYSTVKDLPNNLFDRINLPIIQIYGEECDVDDEDQLTNDMMKEYDSIELMQHIMKRMDVRSKLVVIGYNPSSKEEFPIDKFIPLCRNLQGATVYFYGTGDSLNDNSMWRQMHNALDQMGFFWCSKSFGELLDALTQPEAGIDEWQEESVPSDKSLYYEGKKPVEIQNRTLLMCRYFAQLLTEESVNQQYFIGRTQKKVWFFNFLNDSSISPQWYGYNPKMDFHLKRPFEDILVELVKNIISGKSMYKAGRVTPVILRGDSGSSKSITLAAIAYRFYCEHINPVIFINNDSVLFNHTNNDELELLDALLQEVESAGSEDMRILILLDSASYRNVEEQVDSLVRYLENRGRRFAIVCTAYGNDMQYQRQTKNDYGDIKTFYNRFLYKDGTFKPVSNDGMDYDVLFDGKHYYVQSNRTMGEEEKSRLYEMSKAYIDMDQERLDNLWGSLEKNAKNDIFYYFYCLENKIRPNLEARLSKEQTVVGKYVNKQFELLGARGENDKWFNDSIKQQLLNLKIVIEDTSELLETEPESQNFDLDKFNICIAMFSRFKLDVPCQLGIHMLYKKGSQTEEEFYQNYELFELVTNDIPWIYYGESEFRNFVFRFRNSLEAEIFLKKNDVSAERQVDYVCEMFDYYAELYKSQNCEDLPIKIALQKLIRMMGPNSGYLPFKSNGTEEKQHNEMLKSLGKIIDKLTSLRCDYKVPDSDASFSTIEITFIREYYGKLWDRLYDSRQGNGLLSQDDSSKFEMRLTKMNNALNLALKIQGDLEDSKKELDSKRKRQRQEQINALSVEISYCCEMIGFLQESYVGAATREGIAIDPMLTGIRVLPYLPQYQKLVVAINTSPTDGYAYNALFNLFEKEYEKSDEERKLQLLSEVRMIADDAMSLDITNRGMDGRDTLSEHIQRIEQYSDGYTVKIKEIIDGKCPQSFKALFKTMLDKNYASAITFVCQQELKGAQLDGRSLAELDEDEYVLNEDQEEVCKQILEFMKMDEYVQCIEKDSYALYLMLRVAWMYYNKRPLNERREVQLTFINKEGWIEIHSICEKYMGCANQNKKPIVSLIYALSIIQIYDDYDKASKVLQSLDEEMFSSTARMRAPYIICSEPGIPKIYSGTVISTEHYGGFLRIDKLPVTLGHNKGARFNMKNLGTKPMPDKNTIIKELELGIGYIGFTAYGKGMTRGGRHE